MDAADLQQEVLRLRRRTDRLLRLLQLVVVALRVAEFSLDQMWVPDGQKKRRLLRAIERARTHMPLRGVLNLIGMSRTRYHAWFEKQECGLEDQSCCPRSSPQQLTREELDCVRDMVTAELLVDAARAGENDTPQLLEDGGVENDNSAVDKPVETGLLTRILAQTEIRYSNSLIESWWRVIKHQWLFLNTLDSAASVRKLVAFYVEEYNSQLPHSAFNGQTPDEMYVGTGDDVPKQLEAAKLAARKLRLKTNCEQSCQACVQSVAAS